MQLKKTIIAAALGLGLTSFAQAANYDLGTLYSDQELSRARVTVNTAGVLYNHFDDTFTFTIEPGLQSADLSVFSIDLSFVGLDIKIDSLWVNVYTNAAAGDVGDVLHAQGWLDFVDTTTSKMSFKFAGNIDFTQYPNVSTFVLRISGETIDSGWGSYDVSLKGGPLSAVPEPAEYAMLLAGLGVVGMVARRRRMIIN